MTKSEYAQVEGYFNVLMNRMQERDEDRDDCHLTQIDKGYSLAVSHMRMEAVEILTDLRKQLSF